MGDLTEIHPYMCDSTRDTRGRWATVRPALLLLLLAADSTQARVADKSAPLSSSQALNARQWADAPVVPGRLCPTSSVLGEFVRRHKLRTPPSDFNNGAQGGAGNAWMQRNWEPHLRCVGELRLGQAGDGGKHVCDPDCLLERNACLIYSFGSNNDFGFETSVLPYGCAIHVFDHTGPCALPACPPVTHLTRKPCLSGVAHPAGGRGVPPQRHCAPRAGHGAAQGLLHAALPAGPPERDHRHPQD